MSDKGQGEAGSAAWLDTSAPDFGLRVGLYACIALATIGLILAVASNSLAVGLTALIAAVDIIRAALVVTAHRRSRPTQADLPQQSNSKYESLAAVLTALPLAVIILLALIGALLSLFDHAALIAHPWPRLGYAGLFFASMRYLARRQTMAAQLFQRDELLRDAARRRTLALTGLILLLSSLIGMIPAVADHYLLARAIDVVSALTIAVTAFASPLGQMRRSLAELLDQRLPEDVQLDIISVIGANITRICEFKSIHTRRSGNELFMELDVILPFDCTLEQAFTIEQHIQGELTAKYPNALVRMYAEPCQRDCIHNGRRHCPIKAMRDD